MNKLDQERGKTTEKNHRYCFSVISGRCFMLFFMCLMSSWYASGTGTSRESNIHRKSLSQTFPKGHQSTFLFWWEKANCHHSHPVEHLVSLVCRPLSSSLSRITLIMNPHHHVMGFCTGVFRLPDINPFVLFGSDTRSLSFALPAGQRRTNIPK